MQVSGHMVRSAAAVRLYYLQVLADTWSVLLSLGTSKAKMFVLYSKEFLHMDSFVLRAIFFLPLSLCP
eukprot:scaffold10063_cov79-Skeletonema_marinoi.AAC.3